MIRYCELLVTPEINARTSDARAQLRQVDMVPEARARMEELFRPFDTDIEWFLDSHFRYFAKGPSWVTVFLDREYRLFGHVASVREYRHRMPVTSYSSGSGEPVDEDNIPGVSVFFVPDKNTLASAATKCPMFRRIWDDLKDLAEDRCWLYFADPLPPDWVRDMESKDDALFLAILKKQLGEDVPLMMHQSGYEAILDAERKCEFAEMLRHAGELVGRFPDRAKAHCLLGTAYGHLGMLRDATLSYEKAIELYTTEWSNFGTRKDQPERTAYRPLAASARSTAERTRDEGMGLLESMLAAAEAWVVIGRIHEEDGRDADAIQSYESAIAVIPGYAPALRTLGKKYIQAGRLDDAVRVCEQWTYTNGEEDANSWHALGAAYAMSGRHQDAVVALRRGIDMFPADAHMWTVLADTYLHLAEELNAKEMGAGQLEFSFIGEFLLNESVRCYRTAVGWDEGHLYAWVNMGRAYVDGHQSAEAVDAFRHATIIDPDNAMAWNNLGYTLAMTGRHSAALAACRRATALDPGFASGWDSMGYAYLEAGAPGEAIDALRTAIRLQPRHTEALYHLSIAYHRTNQPQRARQLHNCLGKIDRGKALELGNILDA